MPRYKVQPGDTIFSIATKFGTTPEVIKEDNNLYNDIIKPGQVLNAYSEGISVPQASVTEEMLMESPNMPKSTYNAELKGNEDKELVSHGKNNQTIGAGLDFSGKGSAKINAELARRAGIPEETINSLMQGGQDVNITKEQSTEANKLRFAKAYNDAKSIPGFEQASDRDKDFLADLVYNGAIKKSGYDKKDQTSKAIWDKLKDGDIAGAKKFIRTSNLPLAEDLYNRAERAGFELISTEDFFDELKPIEDKFDKGDLDGIIDFIKNSKDKGLASKAKEFLQVEDLDSDQAKYNLRQLITSVEIMPTVIDILNAATR